MALDLGLPIAKGQRKPAQNLDTVKADLVKGIDACIKAAKDNKLPNSPYTNWLLEDGDGYRVSVRKGIVAVLFAKGMTEDAVSIEVGSMKEAVEKVWKPVKAAIEKGQLDKEVQAAWDKSMKVGKKGKAAKADAGTMPEPA